MKRLILMLFAAALVLTACTGKSAVPAQNEKNAEMEKEEVPEAGDGKGNMYDNAGIEEYNNRCGERIFSLYSFDRERIADVIVPSFLGYVDYAGTKNYIIARDDESYDATYMFYEMWTADDFYNENTDVSYLEKEGLKPSPVSDAHAVTVDGHNATWKKVSGVYKDDITYVKYLAAVETENGIIGVILSIVDAEEDDSLLISLLEGITF